MSSTPTWSLLQFSALLEFLSLLPAVIESDVYLKAEIKPFFPKGLLVMVFQHSNGKLTKISGSTFFQMILPTESRRRRIKPMLYSVSEAAEWLCS